MGCTDLSKEGAILPPIGSEYTKEGNRGRGAKVKKGGSQMLEKDSKKGVSRRVY
jgi:hypothetical protein